MIDRVVAVVKFKVKKGFDEAFIKAVEEYPSDYIAFERMISIGDREYISVTEYASIDDIVANEEIGQNWLDSIDHMLERFDDSRTEAVSGNLVYSYDSPT